MISYSDRVRGPVRALALFLLAGIAALALSGCGIFSPDESDDGGGGGGGSSFLPTGFDDVSPPTGRENVISNLEMAYEELDYPQYERLIHNDYLFRVDPAEVDIVGSASLNSDEDLRSTRAMFNNETGLEPVIDPATGKPTGEYDVVPPVQTIRLDLIPESTSSWTQMADGEFAGAWRRIYEVDMTVTFSGDARIEQIRGKQVFYVTPGTIRGDESGKLYWQLIGWEDQGIDS